MHTPILEKDGQRFIVNARDFVGDDKCTAMEIGIGAGFVECIIWRAKFTGDVLDIEQAEADNLQVTEATLGNCAVFLLDMPSKEAQPWQPQPIPTTGKPALSSTARSGRATRNGILPAGLRNGREGGDKQ